MGSCLISFSDSGWHNDRGRTKVKQCSRTSWEHSMAQVQYSRRHEAFLVDSCLNTTRTEFERVICTAKSCDFLINQAHLSLLRCLNRTLFTPRCASTCVQCSLACHKKCLETLAIQCGHKKLHGRLHLFGIDFTQAANNSPDRIPFIVRKCTSEIESRALNIKVFLPIYILNLVLLCASWVFEVCCQLLLLPCWVYSVCYEGYLQSQRGQIAGWEVVPGVWERETSGRALRALSPRHKQCSQTVPETGGWSTGHFL